MLLAWPESQCCDGMVWHGNWDAAWEQGILF